MTQNGPMLFEAAFMAAMKEYEDDSETEEDGEDIDQRSDGFQVVLPTTYNIPGQHTNICVFCFISCVYEVLWASMRYYI